MIAEAPTSTLAPDSIFTSTSEPTIEAAAEPTVEGVSVAEIETPTEPTVVVAPQGEPKPISEFAGRPDFPGCTLNEFLDIGGFTGVVIKIVSGSLKVKSPEGAVQGFNAIWLRKIYGPNLRPVFEESTQPEEPTPAAEPTPLPESTRRTESTVRSEPVRRSEPTRAVRPSRPTPPPAPEPEPEEAPRREVIEEPNFEAPLKMITEFAGRADFPKCILGEHVEINEFTGVVVEIVKQSLKVRSPEGFLRSYNIPILRKLYGKA